MLHPIGRITYPFRKMDDRPAAETVLGDQCHVKKLLGDRKPLHRLLQCPFGLGDHIIELVVFKITDARQTPFIGDIPLRLVQLHLPGKIEVILREQAPRIAYGHIPVDKIIVRPDRELVDQRFTRRRRQPKTDGLAAIRILCQLSLVKIEVGDIRRLTSGAVLMG